MNVLFLSPSYPGDMPLFTEALAEVGAAVVGVGDTPRAGLPPRARRALSNYIQVPSIMNEATAYSEVIREVRAVGARFDRVETLWEPLVMLAARLREALGVPGMSVAQAERYRDKEAMKRRLDAAGIRTPRHFKCSSQAEVQAAAERLGYPLIVKPIAGAGSADTHRVNTSAELAEVLRATRHLPVVSVEEFIDGREYTFDTISVDGRPLFYNISWYRPRPLLQRTVQWISPQTVALRDPDAPLLRAGRDMGFKVLRALEFESGFTHMEWFLTDSGEAVFCEIGARCPGAFSVDLMNHANDADLYRGWADAICWGRIRERVQRPYNASIIFKRAAGEGKIQKIVGLSSYLARFGQHVTRVDLLPVGAPRRNWKQTLLSDGFVVVRHPDLHTCLGIADRFGTDVQLFAG